MDDLGILTLATVRDWHKAIALACSVRLRNPSVQLAIVAKGDLAPRFQDFFDIVIPERTGITGFAHKLYLDEYSPFTRTLFVDADMLACKDLAAVFQHWKGQRYMARGHLVTGGVSCFGLDRSELLRKLGKRALVNIDGAGHAYFEKPACTDVFERARAIMRDYANIAPGASFADEDVLAIVMTEMGIDPVDDDQIVGFLNGVNRGTLKLDVPAGRCQYVDQRGETIAPALLHFPHRTCPFLYHREMRRLVTGTSAGANVPFRRLGLQEYLKYTLWEGAKRTIRSYLRRSAFGRCSVRLPC